MKVENIKEINTTALAYMGDAVYELAVREEMMKQMALLLKEKSLEYVRFSIRFVGEIRPRRSLMSWTKKSRHL